MGGEMLAKYLAKARMAASPVIDPAMAWARKHPNAAGGLGLAGGIGATLLADKGASALDSLTAEDEIPEEVRMAMQQAGEDPDDFEPSGAHAAQGALTGGLLGMSLAKYLSKSGLKGAGYGALAGGLLGSGVRGYRKRGDD